MNSSKCTQYTGYFRKVYRSLQIRVPLNILKYLSIQRMPQKRSHQYRIRKKTIFILCFNFITKYFRVILLSIILNVHDLYFEDKSSSLTLKYRPVHFSETSCIICIMNIEINESINQLNN